MVVAKAISRGVAMHWLMWARQAALRFLSRHTLTHSLQRRMASATLSIPIAFWTRGISTAAVSTTLTREDFVVAGLEDGLIWVFKGHESFAEESSATQPFAEAITVQNNSLPVLFKHCIASMAYSGYGRCNCLTCISSLIQAPC